MNKNTNSTHAHMLATSATSDYDADDHLANAVKCAAIIVCTLSGRRFNAALAAHMQLLPPGSAQRWINVWTREWRAIALAIGHMLCGMYIFVTCTKTTAARGDDGKIRVTAVHATTLLYSYGSPPKIAACSNLQRYVLRSIYATMRLRRSYP